MLVHARQDRAGIKRDSVSGVFSNGRNGDRSQRALSDMRSSADVHGSNADRFERQAQAARASESALNETAIALALGGLLALAVGHKLTIAMESAAVGAAVAAAAAGRQAADMERQAATERVKAQEAREREKQKEAKQGGDGGRGGKDGTYGGRASARDPARADLMSRTC